MNLEEFYNNNCGKRALLGLDLGEKNIGVAIADKSWTIASPFKTINNVRFTSTADEIIKLVKDDDICGIIIGLPLNMDGTEGAKCQSARQFAKNLQKQIDIEIIFHDERLSTATIQKSLIEADITRQRRAEIIDKLSAAYILQGFLDWGNGN